MFHRQNNTKAQYEHTRCLYVYETLSLITNARLPSFTFPSSIQSICQITSTFSIPFKSLTVSHSAFSPLQKEYMKINWTFYRLKSCFFNWIKYLYQTLCDCTYISFLLASLLCLVKTKSFIARLSTSRWAFAPFLHGRASVKLQWNSEWGTNQPSSVNTSTCVFGKKSFTLAKEDAFGFCCTFLVCGTKSFDIRLLTPFKECR